MSYYTNVILPLVTAESNDPLILWLKNHILLSSSMDCEHCSNPTGNALRRKEPPQRFEKAAFSKTPGCLSRCTSMCSTYGQPMILRRTFETSQRSASPHWSTCSLSSVKFAVNFSKLIQLNFWIWRKLFLEFCWAYFTFLSCLEHFSYFESNKAIWVK